MSAPNNNNNEPLQSYPSPSANHGVGLPFYQNAPSAHRRPGDESAPQQNEGAALSSDMSSEHRDLTDDPQLRDSQIRANLANMMGAMGSGSFGNFAAMPAPATPHHGLPPMSGAPPAQMMYGQASGTPDMDKSKDRRSKASRACDECRRKKIRCDAPDESASMPCTNCARSGAGCAFSRQPMKRGPSKGYIRELAERLNSLEQQVHPSQMPPEQRQEMQQMQRAVAESLQHYSHDGRRPPEPRTGDKRPFDVAEALHGGQMQGYPPPNEAHMQQQHRPPPFSNQQPQQVPGAMQPFWHQGSGDTRQETAGLGFDLDNNNVVPNFDWDEAVVDEYYRLIHQTFPLLPSSKNRLRQKLAECPTSLREACLAALDCLMRTFPTTTLPPNSGYAQALKRTAELLAKYPFDNPSSHTTSTNLVYLQTLLLMALESDNHGPATIRGQAGPSRAEWLGRAAGVAGQLEINTIRTNNQSVMEGDRDSDDRLARRVWWVLFILDRWHASSTADLLKLPENSVVLLPDDQILLGESTYHLARLSFIIGHLAAILTTTKTPSTDVMSPSNPASSLLGLTLAGEIDRFRESVESVWGSLNLVHLSYHHCHLLIKRLNPTTEPSELVGHAVKVATVLNSRLTPVTPLNHHFGALAAMTLCELCDVSKTRAEAIKGLDQMIECLGEGRGLAGRLESEGWDGAVRELVKRKKEKMLQSSDGLHNLADAAVGGDDAKFDPTMLTRYGYLTSLGLGRHPL